MIDKYPTWKRPFASTEYTQHPYADVRQVSNFKQAVLTKENQVQV